MTSQTEKRASIVAEARSWIRTSYHPCGDVKGAGVDCGMLLVRVMVDTGMVAPFDPRPYPSEWHMHRSDERYLGIVTDRAYEVDTPEPGDIAVFRYGRCYSHGGIVTVASPLTVVHAFSRARMVLEEPIAQNVWLASAARVPRYFSLFGPA